MSWTGRPVADQLRVLLHRMDQVARLRPRRVAVSATIDAPAELGERYLRAPELILVEGARQIRAKAFDGHGLAAMARHVNELAGGKARKILVFCNKRDDVERYALGLLRKTRFSDAVFAHHGSMAKGKRERTERHFQSASAALCFATMTLEMGIDIGSVDYVMLAGVPSDVSSLLQRIGRGGRRGDTTRFGYIAADTGEKHRLRTMTALGARGRLCSSPYGFRYSVLAQQALTLAGHHSLTAATLRRAVPRSLWPSDASGNRDAWADELLEALAEYGAVERRGGKEYVLMEHVEQRFTAGSLHSNLDDESGIEVVDRMTGDTLGAVSRIDTKRMGLAGAARRIAGGSERRILTDAAGSASPAKFQTRGGPRISFALAREVVRALGVPEDALALHKTEGAVRLLHGLGSAGAVVLGQLLDERGITMDRKSLGPFNLDVSGLKAGELTVEEGLLERCLNKSHARLEKMIGPGPWAKAVPELWRKETIRTAAGLDEVIAFLKKAQVIDLEANSDILKIAAAL